MVTTVTIPKKEYERLKKIEKQAQKKELEESIERSLKDLEAGRVIRYV